MKKLVFLILLFVSGCATSGKFVNTDTIKPTRAANAKALAVAAVLPPIGITDSAQQHWLPTSGPEKGVLGHLHTECDNITIPMVSSSLRIACTIVLFHTSAQITAYYGGNYKTNDMFDVVWDDTGTDQAPAMKGDPAGVKTWNVRFSMKPNIPHGYLWSTLKVYALFPDNRTITAQVNQPLYSIVDTSKPSPNDNDPSARRVQAVGTISPDPNASAFYGEQTVQFDTQLNRGSLIVVEDRTGSTYGYGARSLPMATADFGIDINLHFGNPGKLLNMWPEPSDGLIHAPTPFDPAIIGANPPLDPTKPNDHKIYIRRTVINGMEQSATLLVIHQTVGSVPPPMCVPPQIPVNGMCVDPPPVNPILIGPANLYKFPDNSMQICGPNATNCVKTN